MKKLLMMMILLVTVLFAGAQEKLVSHKALGAKAAYEVTLTDDTVQFIPKYTVTGYTLEVDTNIWINLNTSKAAPGNTLWIEIAADTTKRYVTFDSSFAGVGAKDSLNIGKTWLWTFTYVADKFVQINRSAEY